MTFVIPCSEQQRCEFISMIYFYRQYQGKENEIVYQNFCDRNGTFEESTNNKVSAFFKFNFFFFNYNYSMD